MSKRNTNSFDSYIHRVLREVNPDMSLSSNTVAVLNDFIDDMFTRVAKRATTLSSYHGKQTISTKHLEAATNIELPTELAKVSIREATNAVTRYNNHK